MSAGASADTPIGTTKRPTPIRAWGGVAAFSLYDEASSGYRLAISRHGGPPEVIAVAAQATAFDLDVGPDKAGSPAIVYSRCASTGPRPRGCDLYRYSLSTGREAKLAGASSPDASESAPTIWGARVAWARTPDADAARKPRIYTRSLSAPRSRRSRRLPGIPSRLCGKDALHRHRARAAWAAARCERRLPGTRVQQRADPAGLTGRTKHPGRRHDLRPRRAAVRRHLVRRAQPVLRALLRGGTDRCGRGRFGAFRYSLRTARYSLARFGRRLTGFSYDSGGRAYEVLAPDTVFGYCGNSVEEAPVPVVPPDCQIVLADPLVFARDRAPR